MSDRGLYFRDETGAIRVGKFLYVFNDVGLPKQIIEGYVFDADGIARKVFPRLTVYDGSFAAQSVNTALAPLVRSKKVYIDYFMSTSGNTALDPLVMKAPPTLTASLSPTTSSRRIVDDYNAETGFIYVSVNGGTPPYTYNWQPIEYVSVDEHFEGFTAWYVNPYNAAFQKMHTGWLYNGLAPSGEHVAVVRGRCLITDSSNPAQQVLTNYHTMTTTWVIT